MALFNILSKSETDYSFAEHFVPKLEGAPEEEQSRLEELRRIYIGEKLSKAPEEVQLINP